MKWLFGFTAIVAMLSSPLSAGVLTLSNASNDPTDPALLDATLEFEVTGDQLVLTVTNLTADPNGYQITEVFFNVSSDVGSLELTNIDPVSLDWELIPAPVGPGGGNPTHVGMFGTFDYVLRQTRGGGINGIDYPEPDNVGTFTFTITPTGALADVTQDDFVTDVSVPDGNNLPAFAAAHFQDGPGGDSSFGAVVIPEASSIVAFAMVGGVLGLVQIRRRRS